MTEDNKEGQQEEQKHDANGKVDGADAFNDAVDAYDKHTAVLRNKWEAKITALKVPANPVPKDILLLVAKIDELGNNVALDLSKAKSVAADLKDRVDTAKALYKDEIARENPTWKSAQVNDAVKVRIARESLNVSLLIANAKFNYMQSVSERLKRKKELIATDRDIMNMSRGLHTPHGEPQR